MSNIIPLLTIGIPSNNQTELLDQAVSSIVSQFSDNINCELCISDNSVTSSTEVLIRDKYLSLGKVSYNRTIDAPSLDENVDKVVRLSAGEYVWIFGDDDLIVEGALKRVSEFLAENAPDILILNSSSFDKSGQIEDSRTNIGMCKNYGADENDVFLAELGGYLTYVGGIVIRRELWLANFSSRNIGTYFAHIDVVCTAKIGRTASYIADPCIKMRLHSQTWTSKHYRIWNVTFPMVIWNLAGYTDEAKSLVTPQNLINYVTSMLSSRAYGRFNLGIWREIVLKSPDSTRKVKFMGFLIALLSTYMLRHMYRIYIRLFKNKRTHNFSPNLALAQLVKK